MTANLTPLTVVDPVVERTVGCRRFFGKKVGGNSIENVNMSNDKQGINPCHRKLPGFLQKGKLCG